MKPAYSRSGQFDVSIEIHYSRPCECQTCELDMFAPVPMHEPTKFLARMARDQDVVLFGTKHNRSSVIQLLSQSIAKLAEVGVTHIGLEIGTDQQARIDYFMQFGTGLEEIEIFHVIDCPEYRCLIQSIRESRLKAVALDLPRDLWSSEYTRDHWMAEKISQVSLENPGAKMFAIVGNLHALKRVDWVDPLKRDCFIQGYLEACTPSLSVYSFVMECTDIDPDCDLRMLLPNRKEPVIVETTALDVKLSVMRLLAARPMRAYDVADAIIVF